MAVTSFDDLRRPHDTVKEIGRCAIEDAGELPSACLNAYMYTSACFDHLVYCIKSERCSCDDVSVATYSRNIL